MAAPSGTMRAVLYDRYGGGAQGLKHAEVPIPSPSKGEVLIRMEATSVNQVDWRFQKGVAWPVMPRKFPFISGFDLAGEVVEVGAGVSEFKPGDKVIAINFPGGGGLAEYAVASASVTAARPPEVSAAQGVCIPIAAVTALRALQRAGVSLDPDAGDGTGRRPLRRAAGQAGRPQRHGHVRRAQPGPRQGARRRRGAGLRDPRGRRAAEPLREEVRRRGALRGGGGPVVRVPAGARRRGHGRGHHARVRGRRHRGPPEADLLQVEAGAAPGDAQEG